MPLSKVMQGLLDESISFKEHVDLSQYSHMRTGGVARLWVRPGTAEEMCCAIETCRRNEVPFKVLGATTNVLFLDEASYGVFIVTDRLDRIGIENDLIVAESGVMLGDLSRFALTHAITGYEGLEGIPGTLGGAVFMNAGAYGYEIKDVVLEIELYSAARGPHRVEAHAMEFGYRSSILQQNRDVYVLRCFMRACPGCREDIYERMELYHAKRHKYQEFQYPNLGSLFAGNIYGALGKRDLLYRIFFAVHERLMYRYKLFRRESPINRAFLNRVTAARYGLQDFADTYSRKTMNCLVNTGQGTGRMLAYIKALQRRTGSRLRVENEILHGELAPSAPRVPEMRPQAVSPGTVS